MPCCFAACFCGIYELCDVGPESACQDFGQVEGVLGGILGDLLPAAKAVGDENGSRGGLPDGWQENPLGQRL